MRSAVEVALFPPYRSRVTSDAGWLREWSVTADALGFAAIVLPEHTATASDYEARYPYTADGKAPIDDDTEFPDPLECLSFIAAVTRRIKLGTAVLVLPNHHPVMLAKRLATLDRLSRGRVELSIGAGWMREEIEAFGAPYELRGRVMDESIAIMRALWADPEGGVTFCGDHFQVDRLHCRPRPMQATIPLFAGGHSIAAARRAGRSCEGFHPLGVEPAALPRLLDIARSAAVDAGRDPAALRLTFGMGLVEDLGSIDVALADAHRAGAHRIQLSALDADPGAIEVALARAAEHLGLEAER